MHNSSIGTKKHIKRVGELINSFCFKLLVRAKKHDKSKLDKFEKNIFDTLTYDLKDLVFGSKDYAKSREQIKKGLVHHYQNNRHHPEYYKNGIDDMNLLDVVEMFFDWKASTERHKNGDLKRSIKINKKRFKMSKQLTNIFNNSVDL